MKSLCLFTNSKDFTQLIKATKDFVSKNHARPIFQTIFIDGRKNVPLPENFRHEHILHPDRIAAYGVDGYKISQEIVSHVSVAENFTAYIRVPRIMPRKDDRVAFYLDEDDNSIVIAYEGPLETIMFKNRQPKEKERPEKTHKDLFDEVNDFETTSYVGLNAKYIMEAATSLADTGFNRLPVVLRTVAENPLKPIKLVKGDSTRIILPVRIKENIYE